MAEVILYEDIFKTLRHIINQITGLDVHVGRLPTVRPARFVHLTPSGGEDNSPVHGQRFFVLDVWGSKPAGDRESYEMSELIRANLKALAGVHDGFTIYQTRPVGAIVWMPDDESNQPRYRQNWAISYRGTVVESAIKTN